MVIGSTAEGCELRVKGFRFRVGSLKVKLKWGFGFRVEGLGV